MFEDGLTLRWNLPECGLCVHRTERVTNQLLPTSETERPISVQCVCVCVCCEYREGEDKWVCGCGIKEEGGVVTMESIDQH